MRIYPGKAVSHLTAHLHREANVLRPHARRQTVAACVDRFQNAVSVIKARHGHNGTEHFLTGNFSIVINIRNHRWSIEKAV